MTTIAALCSELTELQNLLSFRTGDGRIRLVQSTMASMSAKVARLDSFGTAEALQLQQHIATCTSIPGEIISPLETTIDSRLAAVSVRGIGNAHKDGQRLVNVPEYLTVCDWDQLEDPRSGHHQLYVVMLLELERPP